MLHVYIDKISNYKFSSDVYPESRLSEILSCGSDKIKLQKYASWKLLETALKTSLKLNIKNLQFTKSIVGKWSIENANFSISHSNGIVVVAVSDTQVGVDIEKVKMLQPKIEEKILTCNELEVFKNLDDVEKNKYLLTAFTGKESIYKTFENLSFAPRTIELNNYSLKTYEFSLDDEDYYLSVTSEKLNEIKFINNLT